MFNSEKYITFTKNRIMEYNAKDIIRISFKINDLQLFSICINYDLNFRRLQELRNFGLYLWIDNNKKDLLFYGDDNIILTAGPSIKGYTSKELKMLRNMKPLTPTRIKKDLKTAAAYIELVDDFPSIRMDKMDIFIKNNLVIVDDKNSPNLKEEVKLETKVEKKTTKNIELSLNDILDKINESGINSLTKEEKEFLDKLAE